MIVIIEKWNNSHSNGYFTLINEVFICYSVCKRIEQNL